MRKIKAARFSLGASLAICCFQLVQANEARLLPEDKTIEVSGIPGSDSTSRTVRFRTAKPDIEEWLSSPLVRKSEYGDNATIDSAQIRISRSPANEPNYSGFLVQVQKLPAQYGVYEGILRFKSGNEYESVKIVLKVVPGSVALSAPPALSIQLTNLPWPGLSYPFISSDQPLEVRRRIAIPGLPLGLKLRDPIFPPLLSTAGVEADIVQRACVKKNEVEVYLNANLTSADKYSSRIDIFVDGLERVISVPVEVTVRDAPFWALFAIVFGLICRWVSQYVADRGDKVLAAASRVRTIRSDLESLSAATKRQLDPKLNTVGVLLDRDGFEPFNAAAVDLEARIGLARRYDELVAWADRLGHVGQNTALDTVLNGLVAAPLAAITTQIQNIETTLEKVQFTPPAPVGPPAAAAPQSGQTSSAWRRQVFVAKQSRIAIRFVTNIVLVILGFYTIYIKGSPTFGSTPIVDYMLAFAWGLTSDVVSQSLSGLSRTIVSTAGQR
jgi:hypothetical protein